MSNHWKYGLCSCFDDPIVCSIACCVCYGDLFLHLWAAARSNPTNSVILPCCCIYWCGYIGCAINRTAIRTKLGLKGTCCTDWCIWICCPACAAQQEYRAMKEFLDTEHKLKGGLY